MLLLIYCLMFLPLDYGDSVFGLRFVMHHFESSLVFANHLGEEERTGCFTLIVL